MPNRLKNDSANYLSLILEELTFDVQKDVLMLKELRGRNRNNGNLVRTIDHWLLAFLRGDAKAQFESQLYYEIRENHREAIRIISKGLKKVVQERDFRDNLLEICTQTYLRDRIYLVHTNPRVILLADNRHSEFLNFSIDYFRAEPHGCQFSEDEADRAYICHWEKERIARFRTTPDEIDYLFTLGSALMGHGLESYAAARFQEVLKRDPDDHETLLLLSRCLMSMGQYEFAIHYLRRATSIKPDDARPYRQLADCYKELGLFGMALGSLLDARDLGEKGWQIHINIGIAYTQLGDHSHAIESYRKALEVDPGAALAWRNIGLAYQTVGRFDEAIDAYKEYSRFDPINPEPHVFLGELYEEMGDLSRATEAYQNAIEIRVDYSVYLSLGRAYEKLNRIPDAKALYQEALKIYPKGREARSRLFRLDHPDMEDLEEEMVQVVREHPFLADDPDALPVIYEEAKRRKLKREESQPESRQVEERPGLN